MRWIAVLLVILSAGLAEAESYGSALEHRIWDLRSGQEIDRAALVEALAEADVALLGEVHDNADAHMAQGALVRLLQPVGLAVEMIPTAREADLNAYLANGGEPVGIGKAVSWDSLGWPAWEIYRPVFKYFTPGVIKGAALDRAEVRRSMTDGAAAIVLDPPMSEHLSRPLAPKIQSALEEEMVVAHCGHLPKEMAPGMIEAQRLRDAALAAAVLRARAARDGKIVVIAGNGHTRTDRGVGTYLDNDLSVLSLGVLESDAGIAPDAVAEAGLPYDFVWFVPPADREDPCAVFTKHKK
ncbi:MAG: ChaN family lipoprotein [Pseudomonadota bacterium]